MEQQWGLRPGEKTPLAASRFGNRRLLLQCIFDDGPISRADLARLTGLGRATVSDITAGLVAEGLVVEIGQGTSTGGKPPTLVALDADGRFAVALDLGRHPIEAALLNLRGRIVATATGKTLSPTGREAVEEIHRLIGTLLGAATAPALGIGLGVPGAVDGSGTVVRSEQLGWSELAIKDELEEVYGFPTYVAGDAEVAALAEYGRTTADSSSGMLYLKVDDRIGSAVVVGGKLHRASHRGGDLTHVSVPGWTDRCSCGRKGCLGTRVSVIEILGPDYVDMSTEARRRLAADISPEIESAAVQLGDFIAGTVATLDVGKVVVGGEISAWHRVPEFVAEGIAARLGWVPEVVASRLGDSAVVLGSGGSVLSGELGVVWGEPR